MKNLILALIASAGLAFAQTAALSTTLTQNVDAISDQIELASVTGLVFGNVLYVDREAMFIKRIVAKSAFVRRGYAGTTTTPHAATAAAIGGDATLFITADRVGPCLFPPSVSLYNVTNGAAWACTAGIWVQTNAASGGGTGTVSATSDLADLKATFTATVITVPAGRMPRVWQSICADTAIATVAVASGTAHVFISAASDCTLRATSTVVFGAASGITTGVGSAYPAGQYPIADCTVTSGVITACANDANRALMPIVLPGNNIASTYSATGQTLDVTGVQDGSINKCTGSASTTAATCTMSPAPASLATGQLITFVPGATNSGAFTLNVNGLGAIAVKKNDGSTNPASGDLTTGRPVALVYNGTVFLLAPAGAGGAGVTKVPVTFNYPGAGYGVANSVGSGWSLPTGGADPSVGNLNQAYGIAFENGDSAGAELTTVIPTAWDGGTVALTFTIGTADYGPAAATFNVQTFCLVNGNASAGTFGTAQTMTATIGNGSSYAAFVMTLSSLTMGSCTAGAELHIKATRDTGDAFPNTVVLKVAAITYLLNLS